MRYYYKYEGMGLKECCPIREHVFIGSSFCASDCGKCIKYNDSEHWVECEYLTTYYREKKN